MRVYDISVPLRADMPTYSGEPGPRLQFAKQLSKGDSANVSVLSLGSHTGTHVDAPSHFLDGAPALDIPWPGGGCAGWASTICRFSKSVRTGTNRIVQIFAGEGKPSNLSDCDRRRRG